MPRGSWPVPWFLGLVSCTGDELSLDLIWGDGFGMDGAGNEEWVQ